ncbi:MAG: hypothetical protein E7043_04545 [Lentisphaerae bacterium]|nr:hypothetical protein [Lentisphaerota bacterium]
MKKYSLLFLLFAGAILAAENILPADNADEKSGIWSNYAEKNKLTGFIQYSAAGGYQKNPSVKVDLAKCGRLSIEHLRLLPGRKYRFGAYVRTRGLTARTTAFIIHNSGWRSDIRTRKLPENTKGQWMKISSVGVVPVSNNGEYTFSLYGYKVAPDAEVEVSMPFIEPVCSDNEIFNTPANELDKISRDGEFGIWSKDMTGKKIPFVRFIKNGGMDNSDALKVDLSKTTAVITGIPLEGKKIHRFGAFVRTGNLRGTACLLLHNKHWKNDVRTLNLPRDTNGKWVRVECNTVIPESSDGKYAFVLYGNKVNADNSVEICNPYIENMTLEKKIAPGGNVLPPFEATADGEVGLWSRNLGDNGLQIQKIPGAGIDGADLLRMTGSIRCSDLPLVPGEKYRFGACVRTSGGIAKDSRLIIYNNKWSKEVSAGNIPVNTNGQWKKLEATVTMPPSGNKRYSFLFYLPSGGTIEVCKPFLEGVSERAIAETFPAKSYLGNMRRIYPVTPLLTEIDPEKPEVTFSFACPLDGALSDYVCRARLADGNGKWSKWLNFDIPGNRQIKTAFPAVTPGKGELQIQIVRKSDNKTILANRYDTVFPAPLPPFKEVRKNNLVTELVNTSLTNGKHRFVNPRDGWIYIGFRNGGKKATASMGDKVIVRYREGSDLLETMRYLPRGEHEITVADAGTGNGRLIIRTVPEIILFPLFVSQKYDKNSFAHDRNFYRKYLWPNINNNLLTFGWNPKSDWERELGKELDDRGIRRMGSNGFGAQTWLDQDQMRADMAGNWTTVSTVGRACDETDAKASAQLLHTYAEVCWDNFHWNKFVYLWLANTTSYLNYPPVHAQLISGASHIGNGRGKLLMETYVETTPDLPSLEEYYQLVAKHMKYAKMSTPDAPKRMLLIMAGLITNGAWNCNAYPQSDIKYAWDYFFHLVATTPEAEGLYGIGCYNIRYTDEENARWLALLLRHYAIEGKTEMLSPKYGIVYNTNAVVNGDFKEGLKGWEAIPAEENSIKPRTISGYGFSHLKRRGIGHGNGNTAVQLTRSAKAPNKLKQTLKNLTPGKLYSFFYASSDADHLAKGIKGKSDFVLEAELEGAEILPDLSYEFRNPPEYLKMKRLEVVTRKIVFRAKAPEVKVTIRDWKDEKTPGAPIGGKRLVNFIGVSAYYAE